MAINPTVYTEKVVHSFLKYQLSAYPFTDPRLNKIPEYERDVAGHRMPPGSSRADFEASCEILPACAKRFSRSFERENSG